MLCLYNLGQETIQEKVVHKVTHLGDDDLIIRTDNIIVHTMYTCMQGLKNLDVSLIRNVAFYSFVHMDVYIIHIS